MTEFKKFKVVPVLPDNISPLADISKNLWYCWNHDAFILFKEIDKGLWHSSNHNPVKVLEESDQERLNELSRDKTYPGRVKRVSEKLSEYLSCVKSKSKAEHVIGYFSAEYGLTEALPIYSGGLGVLSGDHIKSASDLNINLTGIGLLYQEGYFQQKLDRNGWQQDYYRVNDFNAMPVKEVFNKDGSPLTIDVKMAGQPLQLKVWKIEAGRVNIYMLDSNIDKNSEENRKLTAHLYGGDKEFRLKQEIILGIGGMRIFEKLGIEPDVIHINEGHSCFAIFERALILKGKYSIGIKEAFELSKKSSVFTTHTPVAAGNDEFAPDLIKRYFSEYSQLLGISMDEFIELGKDPKNKNDPNFSMTVAAMKNSSFVNGVSQLHGVVARKMWNHLWNDIPVEHTPVHSITNGIHIPSWISREMKELLDGSLGEGWAYNKDNKDLSIQMNSVSNEELWNVKKIRKEKLIRFVRGKAVDQFREKGIYKWTKKDIRKVLDPEALTIGFARRFASYKRGDLIFRDPERLKRILFDKGRPVQMIIAGKAHPQDNPGKEIIKRITGFINSNGLESKIIFLENYNINIARYLVQGVDLWLNNPIRLYEASGTSGMKAVINGALNLSVMDGWWDEGFNQENGWSIGEKIKIDDPVYRDDVESDSIYSVLENEIIPLFFERDHNNVPGKWLKKVRNSIATLAPCFNTLRMVSDYNEKFYVNAAGNFKKLKDNNFSSLLEFTRWKEKMKKDFSRIKIIKITFEETRNFQVGEKFRIDVLADLGVIGPEDISVEVYLGKMERGDKLLRSELFSLSHDGRHSGDGTLFSGNLPCKTSGNIGFKIRVTPQHELMVNSLELNLIKWK